MSRKVLDKLLKRFGEAVIEVHDQFGDETAVVLPERWKEAALFLRDDPQCAMDHFVDLTAVDYLGRQEPRFEVVLHVRSMDKLHRIRLKTRVDGDHPRVDSLYEVWRGADWFERECYDLFGVEFDGHPNLKRILMYEEFEGHPLRKDYAARRAQPLVPYREEALDKLPPFDFTEGMPFGRQTHAQLKREREDRPPQNVLGFEEDN